jgi:hypothetical protein
MVPPDSFARVIDLMVDSLPLEELGFTHATLNREGNEPNHPANLLKLLIYGRSPNYLRMRQQIEEPIFGIWKRQWHSDHLLLRTKQNVKSEVSLAAITCNLLRLVSVKGRKWVENGLKKLYFDKIIPVSIKTPTVDEFNLLGYDGPGWI